MAPYTARVTERLTSRTNVVQKINTCYVSSSFAVSILEAVTQEWLNVALLICHDKPDLCEILYPCNVSCSSYISFCVSNMFRLSWVIVQESGIVKLLTLLGV
jgi:hypothetical protein